MELTRDQLPPLDPTAPRRPKRRRHMLAFTFVTWLVLQVVVVLVASGLNGAILSALGDFPSAGMLAIAVGEGAAAALTVLVLLWLGGRRVLRVGREDFAAAFRECRWYFVLGIALGVFSLFSKAGSTLVATWPLQILLSLVYSVFVGIMEEGTYRGLLMGGFLASRGGTSRGKWACVLSSAVVFSVAHMNFATLSGVGLVQNILKCLQVMTVALFFSGIALRTRSLWPGALVHGLWDFLNIAPEMIFTTKYSIDYTAVGSHDEAMTLVVFYVVLIVLQSPLMLRGICMVREAEVPFFGWLPPQMPKGARRPRRGDVAPVPASAVAPDAAPGAPVAPGAKHIVSGEDGPLGAPDDASRGDIR